MMFDIDQNWSTIGNYMDGGCNLIKTRQGMTCLQTGVKEIWGVRWDEEGVTRRETTDSPRAESCTASTCTGTQYADMYNIALPGEERKQYSLAVAEKFHQSGAVDWSTHTFKADKLNVTHEIIAKYGNGLDKA
jgi:hypothetical protein